MPSVSIGPIHAKKKKGGSDIGLCNKQQRLESYSEKKCIFRIGNVNRPNTVLDGMFGIS